MRKIISCWLCTRDPSKSRGELQHWEGHPCHMGFPGSGKAAAEHLNYNLIVFLSVFTVFICTPPLDCRLQSLLLIVCGFGSNVMWVCRWCVTSRRGPHHSLTWKTAKKALSSIAGSTATSRRLQAMEYERGQSAQIVSFLPLNPSN